jgi:hypothetical protein
MFMLKNRNALAVAIAASSILAGTSSATATTLVKVTVENIAPSNGTFIAPFWVGFHNGGFDTFDLGQSASVELESLAEDANNTPLANTFLTSGAGVVEGTLADGDFGSGITVTETFSLDETLTSSRYFSYAAMLVPSNDAFIGNDDPLAFQIFDDNGNFVGADFVVTGDRVWDAGTEENDEIPANTALLGQTVPNTGVTTNGVVSQHPGFIAGGNILAAFPNADFITPNYSIARVRVEQVQAVPEPATVLGSLAAVGFGVFFKKEKSSKSRER